MNPSNTANEEDHKNIIELPQDIIPQPPSLQNINVQDFIKMQLPPRENILSPWLPVQGLVMIYAPRGVGKTHIALNVANAITTNTSFLGW